MGLRQQAAHGVRWTSVSMGTTTIVGILQVAVLARLLTRADFGLMTMIMTVIGFAQVYADMGFSAAIIYRQDATNDELSTLYWTNLMASFGLFVVMVAVSPAVAAFYHQPGLQRAMIWASTVFLITPFGQQFQILLQKQLMFRRMSTFEMIASVLGLCVAVVSALAHQGVYALIWGQLTIAGTRSFLLTTYGWRTWRPRLHLRIPDLKGYFGFGMYQMGENTVSYWAANADYLFIGRFLGATPLGLYTIAYQLVVMPLVKLTPVLTRVSFPVFAKRQDDDAALRRGYCEVIELIAFATWPLLIGLAATAPVAMLVIYGARWAPSVILVQLLIPMGMMKAVGSPLGSILNSKGRADLGFWANVVTAVVTVTVLYFAAHAGVRAVAASHSLIQISLIPLELYLLWRISRLRPAEYFRRLTGPLLMSGVMGVCVYATYLAINALLRPLPCLIVLIVEGVGIYLVSWHLYRREYVSGLWRLLIARA